MKQFKETIDNIFGFIILSLAGMCVKSVVLHIIWNWYLNDIHHLTGPQSIGIVFIAVFFKNKGDKKKDDHTYYQFYMAEFKGMLLTYLFLLLIAYIIKITY